MESRLQDETLANNSFPLSRMVDRVDAQVCSFRLGKVGSNFPPGTLSGRHHGAVETFRSTFFRSVRATMKNKMPLANRLPSILFFLFLLTSLLFPVRSLAQLTSQGNEQVIPYSGSTAFVITNTPVNPNLLTGTGTNTFILAVNPPTNAARVYITNETANACSNLTVSIASTGNSSLNSFNNNVAAWQSVNVQTGTGGFGVSAAVTLPASGTIAITSQPIIGSRIAVFVVLSSACLTTNVDVQVVFGTFTPAIGAVQGIVATGQPASGVNPLIAGGVDVSNNARPFKACQDSSAVNCTGGNGYLLPIGAGGNTLGSAFSNGVTAVTTPNALAGPLAVVAGGAYGTLGTSAFAVTQGSSQIGSSQVNTTGLLETRSGFYRQRIGLTVTGTLDDSPTGVSVFQGNFSSCFVTVKPTLNSGTTPTLNVYFQTGGDAVTFTDRISFTQFTASGNQAAGIGSGSGFNPIAFTNGTLAQTTRIDGPIGPYLNMHMVAGGTTPNWTVTYTVACY